MTSFVRFNVSLLLLCFGVTIAKKDLPTDFVERANTRSGRSTIHVGLQKACPQTSYKFPNRGQTTNYIRVTKPIPDLHEFSMCGWFTRSTNGYDSWISYANDDHTNAFLLVIPNDKSTTIYVKEKVVTGNLAFKANKEYHICIASFASSTGNIYIFVNGQLEDIFRFPPGIVKGRGVFVVGQDQDVIGGGFDPNQSAQGNLSNFMVWNEVFEFNDYQKLYQNRCLCPENYIFSLENVELFGGVSAVLPHVCPQEGLRYFAHIHTADV